MTKEEEILDFLSRKIFNPVLTSSKASSKLKQGVQLTKNRMTVLNAEQMIKFFWSAIAGTEKSSKFGKLMLKEEFTRFEDVQEEFRNKFNDDWLRK